MASTAPRVQPQTSLLPGQTYLTPDVSVRSSPTDHTRRFTQTLQAAGSMNEDSELPYVIQPTIQLMGRGVGRRLGGRNSSKSQIARWKQQFD